MTMAPNCQHSACEHHATLWDSHVTIYIFSQLIQFIHCKYPRICACWREEAWTDVPGAWHIMYGLLSASPCVWLTTRAAAEVLKPLQHASSSARGAGESNRPGANIRRGHSLERTVFRKCTFGAKRRLHAWRLRRQPIQFIHCKYPKVCPCWREEA